MAESLIECALREIPGGFERAEISRLSGGSICQAFLLERAKGKLFLKTGNYPFAPECAGLDEIGRTATLRVPKVVSFGESGGGHWLALEHVEMRSRGDFALQGRMLAAMHRATSPRFGWKMDGFIGLTPQQNEPAQSWVAFWRDKRLGFQLALASKKGFGKRLNKGERLLEELGAFFTDYQPQPSLLHGDLWAGNAAFDETGFPVVFDPAVYYGDREADLAMSELFGGFDARFYAAYRESFPLDQGYGTRKKLYNLYHVLNHLNLFGEGYLGQAQNLIESLCAQLQG